MPRSVTSTRRSTYSVSGRSSGMWIERRSPYSSSTSISRVSAQPARVKVLRTTRGDGSGEPGALLDSAFTVACGEGAVRVLQVQRAGRQPMDAAEFLRGARLAAGARLA